MSRCREIEKILDWSYLMKHLKLNIISKIKGKSDVRSLQRTITDISIYGVLFLVLFYQSLSQANPSLVFDQYELLGRIPFFKSDLEYSYYLPFGLSSELDCHSLGNQKTLCSVKVYNNLNAEETKLIESQGATTALSDLSYNVVQKIDESLDYNKDWITESKPTTLLLKSLRMTEYPYGFSSFKISVDRLEELKRGYIMEGLGQYSIQVSLKARETKFYLAINSFSEFKERLLDLEGRRLTSTSLETELEKLSMAASLKSKGFLEPKKILKKILQVQFFQKTSVSRWRLNVKKVNELTSVRNNELVLLDDTTEDNSLRCQSTLELRLNALPKTECHMEENEHGTN